jgi:hypothetical protein
MVGHPPTNPTTYVEISYAAREHYPPSPAESSEGWLEELGNVLDGGDEDLHAPTIAEQTTLLESFNSMRQRALQATGADIEGNIVELSRHTAALEEHGRWFTVDERHAMAAMDAVRETNRQNAMRVAHAASVAAEEAMIDAVAEVAAMLEMNASKQAAAHAAMEAREADTLAAVGTIADRLRMDATRMAPRQHWRNSMSDAAAKAEARALALAWREQEGADRR